MALRNFDLDSALRNICHGSPDLFGPLVDACNDKMRALGLKANPSKAVGKAPRHRGRRNPQAGQFMGSADLNVRGLTDYVDSIDVLPTPVDADHPDHAATEQSRQEMQAAHDKLVTLHATLSAHSH